MDEQPTDRQWKIIEVPAKEFSTRLEQLTATGTFFSRLALIHQVAKAYAAESVNQSGDSINELEIEEITDPPLYGSLPDDEPVIVRFSYYPQPPKGGFVYE